MDKGTIIILVIIAVLVIAAVILYFLGKKAQKRQIEQQEQIDAHKQTVTMLVIDKKMMKLKDAGLPAQVLESTSRIMRNSKVPIVKVKVGPQIMTMISDAKIFDSIPVKKEVKAVVSGIYITEVKGLRGKAIVPEQKKKGKFRAWIEKMQEKAGAKPL